jgi:eukaryotic-like serine/threonine-protein kinase
MSEPLAINSTISHYRIISKLGAGGMGEVYRALDTRLDREVAIKVLPAAFAQDAERLRRFEQEARATSALNHPNILTVYDIGSHEGAPFIVAELLEGEELRAQLEEGALPVRKALDYAQQIAAGLTAAHEKAIVHRDLKPENLFVTKDGRVKILDFGLAKLRPPRNVSAGSDVATQKQLTNPGTIMGTVAYMSPEQVRGQDLDHRSDIFSFGIILHEMLSGRRPFTGESQVEVMNAILKEDPPELHETNQKISPALDKIVQRCLEKKPERRFQTASDLGFALEALSAATLTPSGSRLETGLPMVAESQPLTGKARLFGNARAAWVAAGLLLLALLAALPLAIAHLRQPAGAAQLLKLSMTLPGNVLLSGMGSSFALSPDGRRLAFIAFSEGKERLWVRSLDSDTAQPLAGTEGVTNISPPFWSPDSRFVGFFAEGKLKTIDAAGGPVQVLCNVSASRGGAWNRDGTILFGTAVSPIARVGATGGEPQPVTTFDQTRGEATHRWPCFLPDGRHFIYFVRSNRPEYNGAYLGSLDGNVAKLLVKTNTNALYAPPGYLLFLRNDTLLAQPFDAGKLELSGEPLPIAEHVSHSIGQRLAAITVAENGVLAFRSGGSGGNLPVWFDRRGHKLGSLDALGKDGAYVSVALSRDEQHAAIERVDPQPGNIDIWLFDLVRKIPSRFTSHPANDWRPIWSPDGREIVFSSLRAGSWDLYLKKTDGLSQEEPLFKPSGLYNIPDDWSPDGKFIVYTRNDQKTKEDLWVLPMTGNRQPHPLLQSEFNEGQAQFSPDGKWIAYSSDETGTREVYLQPFPASGDKRRVSTGGGESPRFRRDGHELFYISGDRKIMAVEIKLGAAFEARAPVALFETHLLIEAAFTRSYAVSGDGQRFLVNSAGDGTDKTPISVVVNWTAGVKK